MAATAGMLEELLAMVAGIEYEVERHGKYLRHLTGVGYQSRGTADETDHRKDPKAGWRWIGCEQSDRFHR